VLGGCEGWFPHAAMPGKQVARVDMIPSP